MGALLCWNSHYRDENAWLFCNIDSGGHFLLYTPLMQSGWKRHLGLA